MVQQTSGPASFSLTLPSDREIVMTRVFDAPRDLVFEAHSKPDHARRWWGLRDSTMVVCDMDFRPGGAWRFVLREAGGQENAFRGIYKEIVRPERIVWTFVYEPYPDNEAVETLVFTERAGKTTLTVTSDYGSREVRDMVVQSGMEGGARETWDRLEEVFASMKNGFRVSET